MAGRNDGREYICVKPFISRFALLYCRCFVIGSQVHWCIVSFGNKFLLKQYCPSKRSVSVQINLPLKICCVFFKYSNKYLFSICHIDK